MKGRNKIVAWGLIVASVCLVGLGGAHGAALQQTTQVGGNGLRISPVRTDLVVQPGSSQTITINLQNLTQTTEQLQGIVNDFEANSNESGQPDVLLDGESAPSHGLKQFVAPLGAVTLQPNEQKDVKVTITVPAGTAGGGYYGVVRFAPGVAGGSQSVNLAASVGSLVLIKVPGNIKENVTIASFDVRKDGKAGTLFTSGKGLQAMVRFSNQGNVQEQPFGKVLLKRGGRTLATYEINNTDPRGNVLPDSIRRFSVALDKVGSFGKYSIEGNFGYGSSGQLLEASKTFYVVPLGAVLLAVLLLALIVLAIFGLPRLMRGYNRRIIQRASAGQVSAGKKAKK